jgi:hypothetical protein
MVSPIVTSAGRGAATDAALDVIYRTERHWRQLAVGASLLGACALWADYRASGVVLMALCLLCQLISWAAMRSAQRIHAQAIAAAKQVL